VKSTQVFQCPSEPKGQNAGSVDDTQLNGDVGAANRYYTDYYINSNISYSDRNSSDVVIGTLSAAKLISSANTVLLGDSTIATQSGSWPGKGEPWNFSSIPDNWNHYNFSNFDPAGRQYISGGLYGAERHLEGANYAFADGHVKWLKFDSVKKGDSGCTNGVNSPTGSNATFCID
jgi:prepilin-type processing-associated H-X9-DG protein